MNLKIFAICILIFSVLTSTYGSVSRISKIVKQWLEESDGNDVEIIYDDDAQLDFKTRVSKHGYSVEDYQVETADGYKLTLFRMNSTKCDGKKEIPVLLGHGIAQNAIAWTDLGNSGSVAYNLADQGYDVWVANFRGNRYANTHIKYTTSDSEFWDYCSDDRGLSDLPAIVDKVLEITGAPKLNYIGVSEGARSFFILCSSKPEYQKKISLAITMAPVTWINNLKNVMVKVALKSPQAVVDAINDLIDKDASIKKVESMPDNVMNIKCSTKLKSKSLCHYIHKLLSKENYLKEPGMEGKLFANLPEPITVKNLMYYSQQLRKAVFQKYDYGEEKNLKLYEQKKPPQYDMTKVDVPVVIIYSKNDFVVNSKAIEKLKIALPNVREMHEIKDSQWNHYDYHYNNNASTLLIPVILKHLENYNSID